MPLVGHGTLRYVLDEVDHRRCMKSKLAVFACKLKSDLPAGLHGLSFGLIYPPAIFADNNELEQIVRIAVKCKGIITIHLRSESD